MTTINVTAGQSLQSAIDNAQPGDIIKLEAGATFLGPIELPAKSGEAEIIVQSSRAGELPLSRIDPSHSPLMPKIVARDGLKVDNPQAIRTKPGAHHYKFDGLELTFEAGASVIYQLIQFGGNRRDQSTLASVPHHLKVDRCYIHGHPTSDFQSGIQLNSSDSEVTRSYISEIHGRGKDSQAILSWNTPGRLKIIDCYLEAAGENVMFGGADPASIDFIPSDIEMSRCHLFKPLAWKGAGWVIKNILEFKNAQRVVVNACVFENNWGGEGQAGIGILFTVRNQEGSAPYSIVKDILLTNSIVKNCQGGALNFLGTDNEQPSAKASNVTVRNCIFDAITGTFITISGFDGVTVERVTHFQRGNTILFYGGIPSQRFVYRLNVTKENEYGIRDENGEFTGKAALDRWAPAYVFAENVMATPYTSNPSGNEYPESVAVDSNYRHSFTGKGADVDAIAAAQGGTVTVPVPVPTPTPTPTPEPVPVPVPEPVPTPVPEPQPTPIPPPPTPVPTISAPQSINVPRYGSGQINVTLSNLTGPTTVTVVGSSGQVQVFPLSATTKKTSTSEIIPFTVRVKHQSRTITFQTPFGSASVRVNVT